MRIAGLTTVRNEEFLIGSTIAHLLDQGIDHIYAQDDSSTDSTFEILESFGSHVTVSHVHAPHHLQAQWMNHLAELAHREGFEYIVPFDADEWWFGAGGCTVREAIERSSADVLRARLLRHWSWDYRDAAADPHDKVAYRYRPGVSLVQGNHGVDTPAGWCLEETGALEIREWKYRSADHFVAKIRSGAARTDPAAPLEVNRHYRDFAHLTDAEVRAVYEGTDKEETFDPIPSRFRPDREGADHGAEA